MTAADFLHRVDECVATWAARRDDLLQSPGFPDDVWRALAERGLGGNHRALAAAAWRMTEHGGVMGVTLSWLSHNLNARLHLLDHGTAEQQADWLPRLARGETSICVAISEPGAGGHPKHLKTSARRDGGDWVIDGEKAYLTNEPLAGLFIVLAITGARDGRKTFSALLVPRDAPGLRLTPGVEIDFLHPSPHCGIELAACRVPAGNLLGDADAGLAQISLPMRATEDALTALVLAGAVAAQLRGLAGHARRDLAAFGALLAKAQALAALAADLAGQLDREAEDPGRLAAISAGFRGMTRDLQDDIDAFTEAHGVVLSMAAGLLRRDLVKSLDIAASVQAAKRARAFMREEQTR